MSAFNAEQFVQTRVRGAMDTKFPVIPQGEYRGQIEKITAREQEIKKGDRAGQTIVVMDITWAILDERLRETLKMEKIFCRQSMFLDLTPEGQLDLGTGKNVSLGKLREALGQNDKKKDWFPSLLQGAVGKVQVAHRPNDQDPTSPYSEVSKVAPLS